MRILRWIGLGLLVVIVSVVMSGIGLFIAAAGDYSQPLTVVEDPALPSVTLDGVRFHAETFGDPANPMVLILHGGPGGDYRYLLPLQALADEHYVVFYDQRGTGLSQRVPKAQLTLQTMVDDVGRMVDHYGGGEPVAIVGHSWGAMLGAAYAEQHPDKVGKLVLAEPGALTTDNMSILLEKQRDIVDLPYILRAAWTGFQAAHLRDPAERTDYLIGTMAHYWASHPDNAYNCPGSRYESVYWRWGGDAFNEIVNAARDEDGVVRLDFYTNGRSALTSPVLFVASSCNTWIGEAWQHEQMKLYADANLLVIEDSGHEMFSEAPERSIPPVAAYLRDE